MNRIIILSIIFASLIFCGIVFVSRQPSQKETFYNQEKNTASALSEENNSSNESSEETLPLSNAEQRQDVAIKKPQVDEAKDEIVEKIVQPSEVQTSRDLPEENISQNSESYADTKEPAVLSIQDNIVSWGYRKPKTGERHVQAIIIHSSYNSLGGDVFDVEKIIHIWKSYEVSPHYVIDRKGNVQRLVKEENIAYHAGVSSLPSGLTAVNEASIGIELVGDLASGYSDAQYRALNVLIDDIEERYNITYILGHDEIAPGRKTDPWNIDWKRVDR